MMKYKLSFTIFFFLNVNIGCANYTNIVKKECYLIDKESEILEKVSNEIIDRSADIIYNRKEAECEQSLLLHIYQQKIEKNEFKCYIAYFSESGLYENELPTYLWIREDVYIAIYLDNKGALSKQEIPENLLEDYDDCYRYEDSWLILICDNIYKVKVIEKGLLPVIAVKQFQEFSCDIEDTRNRQIKIENAVVDTVLMEEIMKSLWK